MVQHLNTQNDVFKLIVNEFCFVLVNVNVTVNFSIANSVFTVLIC